MGKNIFGTVISAVAPSANFTGESESNRVTLQKVKIEGVEHAVLSSETLRNAIRETLAAKGAPCNRSRIPGARPLAVEYKELPNADKFADDFLFGYMVVDAKLMKDVGRPLRRDSLLRVNLAVALAPYVGETILHQAPMHGGKSPWTNLPTSQTLNAEITVSAYQFPFAISVADCLRNKSGGKWLRLLLESIGELNHVAGAQGRSHYEMAPRSILLRVTDFLVAGFDNYCFASQNHIPELARINDTDLPGGEFWLGGAIVREMAADERKRLTGQGCHLFDNPQVCLAAVAKELALADKR